MIFETGKALDNIVGGAVPDVDSKGKISLGLHGQVRLDSPALGAMYKSCCCVLSTSPRDGGTLRTVEDVRTYMLALPKHRQIKGQWQHAVTLLLTHGDVVDLTRHVELALFYDAKLDLAK